MQRYVHLKHPDEGLTIMGQLNSHAKLSRMSLMSRWNRRKTGSFSAAKNKIWDVPCVLWTVVDRALGSSCNGPIYPIPG